MFTAQGQTQFTGLEDLLSKSSKINLSDKWGGMNEWDATDDSVHLFKR